MASPDFRSAVLSELRWQVTRDLFDLSLAAARLQSTRGDVLSALAWLRGAGLARFDVDTGWTLESASLEVA
jgi:hypothetical protein